MASNLIFLDTETTGLGASARLCQIAFIYQNQLKEELFNPGQEIEIEASATHHITSEMVQEKEKFSNSNFKTELINILDKSILVAHNAEFDIAILARENIIIGDYICTFKISKYLNTYYKKNIKHNLQFLRYYFKLNIENATAHNARGDTLVLKEVFNNLFEKMKTMHPELKNEKEILNKMIEISAEPIKANFLFGPIYFGKYKGLTFDEIYKKDKKYLIWLLDQQKSKEEKEQNKDLIFTINCFLNSN